jgi:preprotein translocase subunit SecG
MFYLVLSLHIFLCIALVVLVLLQQGKGASAGAVLGGSSNTLFGASGANTVLTKVTTGFAIAFMFTSVVLVKLYGGHAAARTTESNPLQGSVMNQRVAAPMAGEAVAPAQGSDAAGSDAAGSDAAVAKDAVSTEAATSGPASTDAAKAAPAVPADTKASAAKEESATKDTAK